MVEFFGQGLRIDIGNGFQEARISDFKQNGKKEKIKYYCSVFHGLSRGAIFLVVSVSSRNQKIETP